MTTDNQNTLKEACADSSPSPLFSRALRAICLTRDYVGEDLLPAVDGWEWYDAGKALAKEIPDDVWAEEFRKRTVHRRKYACRLCNKTAHEIGGYLTRVNEKEIPAEWECRPSCDAAMSHDDRVLSAIHGENAQGHVPLGAEKDNENQGKCNRS